MLPQRFKTQAATIITLLVFSFTTIVFGPVSPAMAGDWTQITTTNMPENYSRAGIAKHTNGYYVYLVGGISNIGSRWTTCVWRYDTRAQEYTRLGDIPVGLERSHVIFYNNSLYIIGGTFNNGTTNGGQNSTVYKFDLVTNTCTTLGNAPRTPAYTGMAVQGSTAYFYGGRTVEGLMKYDLTSDMWTELGNGPRGLDQLWYPTGFATSDGKVHFYGGRHLPTETYFNDVVTYNPSSGTFSTSEIPANGGAKYLAQGAMIGSKLVIAGGSNQTQTFSEVISFDYATKSWSTETSLPYGSNTHMMIPNNSDILLFHNGNLYSNSIVPSVPEKSWSLVETVNQPTNYIKFGSAQDNNYLYFVGGEDINGTILKDVYRFDPLSRTYTKLADLPVAIKDGIGACVKNGYLYVFGGMISSGTRPGYVFRLSLTDNTWENLGSPSEYHFVSGLVTQGNYGYFFGGTYSNETLVRYDFSSNTWTNLGSNSRGIPHLVMPSGFSTPDGKVNFYGGDPMSLPRTNDVVSFDLASGTFSMTSVPPFGTPKSHAKNVQLGSKIYLIGGLAETGGTSEVLSYDTASGLWANEADLPVAGSAATAVFGGTIFAYSHGDLYQLGSGEVGGSGIMQAIIQGQSAAYFSPSAITPTQVTLDGTDGIKARYTTSPWKVTDARGTGAGWYATMSATTPTSNDGKTVSLTNLKLTVTNVIKGADASTSSNPAMLQAANGVTLEAAKTLLVSPANQGMGTFDFTPTLELSVPASSYAGQYTSTISTSFYETAPLI